MDVESKAYKVWLQPLNEEQTEILERWAVDNTWRSALVRQKTRTIWVALRERKRSQAAWARHVKEVLAALQIRHVQNGSWLSLCSIDEAREAMRQPQGDGGNTPGEEKVIALHAASRTRHASTIEIARD